MLSNSCLVYKTVTCDTTVGVSIQGGEKNPKKQSYSIKTRDAGYIPRQELKYHFKDNQSFLRVHTKEEKSTIILIKCDI